MYSSIMKSLSKLAKTHMLNDRKMNVNSYINIFSRILSSSQLFQTQLLTKPDYILFHRLSHITFLWDSQDEKDKACSRAIRKLLVHHHKQQESNYPLRDRGSNAPFYSSQWGKKDWNIGKRYLNKLARWNANGTQSERGGEKRLREDGRTGTTGGVKTLRGRQYRRQKRVRREGKREGEKERERENESK